MKTKGEEETIEGQKAAETSKCSTSSDSAGWSTDSAELAQGEMPREEPRKKPQVSYSAGWDEGSKVKDDPFYLSFLACEKNGAALKRLLKHPLSRN